MSFEGGVARCAVHPEVPARATPCARCGAFACDACFASGGYSGTARATCAACRARTGADQIAWEREGRGFFDRLTETTKTLFQDPREAFRGVGDGPILPPLIYALIMAFIGWVPLFVCIPIILLGVFAAFGGIGEDLTQIFSGEVGAAMCILTVALPLYPLFIQALAAGYFFTLFHLTALLAGGRGTATASLRGVLYTSAVLPVNIAIFLFAFIPFVGPVFNLSGQVFKLVWTGWALSGVAESAHGLPSDRATLVGQAPGAALAMAAVSAFVLLVALALSGALDNF